MSKYEIVYNDRDGQCLKMTAVLYRWDGRDPPQAESLDLNVLLFSFTIDDEEPTRVKHLYGDFVLKLRK